MRVRDSYPEPFPCAIKPRSQAMEALICANGNEDEDDVLDLNRSDSDGAVISIGAATQYK